MLLDFIKMNMIVILAFTYTHTITSSESGRDHDFNDLCKKLAPITDLSFQQADALFNVIPRPQPLVHNEISNMPTQSIDEQQQTSPLSRQNADHKPEEKIVSKKRKKRDHKPFVCPVCKENFNQSGNLTRHVNRHIVKKQPDLRPYFCIHCDYRALRAENVKVHSNSRHEGVLPIVKVDLNKKAQLTKLTLQLLKKNDSRLIVAGLLSAQHAVSAQLSIDREFIDQCNVLEPLVTITDESPSIFPSYDIQIQDVNENELNEYTDQDLVHNEINNMSAQSIAEQQQTYHEKTQLTKLTLQLLKKNDS